MGTTRLLNSYQQVRDGSFPVLRQITTIRTGTHVTWGLNLGANNITNAVREAQSLVKAFKSQEMKSADVILDFIELGNEADLYRNNGLRPSNYSPVNYTAEYVNK